MYNLAANEFILIENEIADGYQGRILYHDGCGIIKINSRVRDLYKRNFIIAHELGHFYHDNGSGAFCKLANMLHSTQKKNEVEANAYASELLYYREWFDDFTLHRSYGNELINDISKKFRTSISSAALRYSIFGKHPSVVVASQNKKVLWFNIHKKFPFQRLNDERYIPEKSYAATIFNGYTLSGNLLISTNSEVWFKTNNSYSHPQKLCEFTYHMPSYQSTLTLLWEY